MPQVRTPFTNYFDSNVSLLKYYGFWVFESPKATKEYLLQFYNIALAVYVYLCYFPAEILFVFFTFHDLDQFLRSLRDLGNHISLLYKTVNYFMVRKQILGLITTLETIQSDYERFENFDPKAIAEQHKLEAQRWTSYFWYFCTGICITMFGSGLYIFIFDGEAQFKINEDGRFVYRQKQPVNTVSPFGNETRSQFLITFFYTIVALTLCAWMIVALDSLFISLMSCVSAHLHILQGAFKTVRERCLSRLKMAPHMDVLYDPFYVKEEVHLEMRKCIKHLQHILSVSEELESIYHSQTFFQTFISLGEMCFSLYLLSEAVDENMGNEVTYLIATGFEILMYCWFGNRITETGMAVSYALYDSDWFSTSPSFRKELIFTMTRLKRPITVTIGKITPLTFTTFLTMVRGAYSFFTFLKQRDGLRHKLY